MTANVYSNMYYLLIYKYYKQNLHSVAQPLPTYLIESVFELERRKHAIGLYIRWIC